MVNHSLPGCLLIIKKVFKVMEIKRLWEVDFFRGMAIILMIIFNYSFTLRYFRLFIVEGGWLYWYVFPRLIAGMFIFIAGISLVLSYNRVTKSKKFYLKRGLKIFGLGLLITLVTFFLFPEEFIIFGILHLIGVAIIFSIPFLNLKKLNLILGLSIILIGFLLENLRFDFSWLLWLGLKPKSFITLDYFPIFPWFGVILLGIFIGNTIYKKGKRSFKIKDCSN